MSIRHFLFGRIFRNCRTMNGDSCVRNQVNLEWWNQVDNVGDYLSKVVFQWMLDRKEIINKSHKTIHLLGIGSVLGICECDAVVWGSGIHALQTLESVIKHHKYVKYDIRALRGPVTKTILEQAGYDCTNARYGDPAILMPLIYAPKVSEKVYDISVISHLSMQKMDYGDLHQIDIRTTDYKLFIDEILKSRKIISSSLHGIILAEAYGIPAVFYGAGMEKQYLKYYDWYYATNRYSVKIARTLEEAINMEPMPLPDLEQLREGILESFPYDLFCE